MRHRVYTARIEGPRYFKVLQDRDNFDVEQSFKAGLYQAELFWRRMGSRPDFTDKYVLEIGSGLVALSVSIAQQGARRVLGLDVWAPRVATAVDLVATHYPELSCVAFAATPSTEFAGEAQFDIVVSQNTFEHVRDVAAVLASIRRLLRPGGKAYIGFSPLYHSPFGDHSELRARIKLPWLHLIAGRKRVIAAFNRANDMNVETLVACGYNGCTPRQFDHAFATCGLDIKSRRVNPTEGGLKNLAMVAFRGLARLPGLEPYFTVGLYFVLQKPEASTGMGQA